ncbi:MAG: exonuclease domain-containing protein, partial [Chloroflexota bacterium]
RAYAFLQERGGLAAADDLAAALFGATAKGPLWAKMLARVLAGDPRFSPTLDGGYALAGMDAAALPLEAVDFVVLDVESTGLKPWRHRVAEVAALRVATSGHTVEAYATLVNPGRRLPKYLADLAGLSQEDLAEAPPFAAVAEDLRAFLAEAVLVGHGLSLDLAFLQRELALLGRPPLANPVLDTLDLAGRLLPGRGKPTLDNLAALLGLPVGRRHRALADARLVAAIFAHLLGLARAEGATTLGDLLPSVPGDSHRRALLDASPLREVTEGPGVYLLLDAAGLVVYVGKGVNLRERLGTYFSRPPDYVRRMEGLLEAVADFATVPLGSELEALLWESRLIAAHAPRFNVQRLSNAQPAYIRLDLQEQYPRLAASGEPADDGANYYGPLRNGRAVRDALRVLGGLFPLRTCHRKFGPRKGRKRAPTFCVRLGLGGCLGPCVGFMIDEEYRALAEELARFLGGDRASTLQRLQAALGAAVVAGDRPEADRQRKRLRAARLFDLPGRTGWLPPANASLAVVQPSLVPGAAEVFVLYEGRYAGQRRVVPAAVAAEGLAASLRELALGVGAGSTSEANLVVRWLGQREHPPVVDLPTADGDWERAGTDVLSLAGSMSE